MPFTDAPLIPRLILLMTDVTLAEPGDSATESDFHMDLQTTEGKRVQPMRYVKSLRAAVVDHASKQVHVHYSAFALRLGCCLTIVGFWWLVPRHLSARILKPPQFFTQSYGGEGKNLSNVIM